MNNTISLIMLGLLVIVCINYMVKGFVYIRRQKKEEPAQNKEEQIFVPVFFLGVGVGFFGGAILGATYPQIIFSHAFLRKEGAELAAIFLLAIIFSVICGIAILPLFSYLKKRA